MDLLSQVRQKPMTGFQIRSVIVAIAILILDGFDISVMAFAATQVAAEWSVSDTSLGLVLSASLIGMAVGSVFISPLADRLGRRPVLLSSLGIIVLGMFLTSLAPNLNWLFFSRFLTGLGAGGMISNCVVLVSEYSNDRRRSFLTAIQAAGYPLGATLSGIFAGALIPHMGWRSVFEAGAALSLVLLILAFLWLPESLDYMLTKGDPRYLRQVNRLLDRMGVAQLSSLPTPPRGANSRNRQGVTTVLSGGMWVRSSLLWLGYGLLISGYYFINSWTPKIISASSSDPQAGVIFGVIINAGGIIGVILFAFLVLKIKPSAVLIWILSLTSLAFVSFALFYGNFAVAITIASLLGLFATTGIGGFQTVGPQIYESQQRASGVGFMIGFGRILSILSPIIVGTMLDKGVPPERLFSIFSIPLLISGLCALGIHRIMNRESKLSKKSTLNSQ